MLVKALVRAVSETGTNTEKPMAIVTLEVSNPLEIVQVRLFKQAYNDGTVARFKQAIDAQVDVPLQPELYNGRLSYAFPFGETLQIPAKGVSGKPAAVA